ncbi:MAG: FAD-binding oxidoreductase [Gammaproteobacteria bacterium]|nr:MAG: FAD-binding oxidoreductase [Gammaproteobacteria bacterium]
MHYVDSYYRSSVSPGAPRPALAGDVDTEVCVIGGGLAGLATALGLRERGTGVVLLEARQVGWGASGRNGGFVGSGYSLPAERLIARVGLQQARELHALTRDAVALVRRRIRHYRMDCEPLIDGGLNASWFDDCDAVLRSRDFLAANFDEQREFWPRERVREVLHTSRYYDALFSKDKFHFHPLNYSRAMAAAAEQLGASIHECSAVQKLDVDGADKVVHTAGGRIRAAHVVMACGGYLDGLQRRLSAAMVPVATYMIATEPFGGECIRSAIDVPYAISDNRFASDYYRALADTRILWGGRISARRSKPARLAQFMLADLLKVYPQLEGARVASAWYGLMSYAVHKMPQIGQLSPGLWYAMGFGGSGMGTTTVAGELVASAIADNDDRYRLFAPFGLTPTGGPVGVAAAQLTYWAYRLRDGLRQRLSSGRQSS